MHSSPSSTPLLHHRRPSHPSHVHHDTHEATAALEKGHTRLSLLGLAFAILNSWVALAASLSLALPLSGPLGILLTLPLAFLGNLSIALSLASYLSRYPSARGQYLWVAILAPERWKVPLSFLTAWSSLAGWIFLTATGGTLGSSLFLGGVALLRDEDAQPGAVVILLVYVGITMGAFAVVCYAPRALPGITRFSLSFSLCSLFLISLTALLLAPSYNSPFRYLNTTSYPAPLAFALSLLQPSLALTAYDSIAHLVSELPNPALAPPLMPLAVLIGAVSGGFFLLVLLSCTQDLTAVTTAPHGALLEILVQATSRKIAVALGVLPLACIFFATIGIMTTASRMVLLLAGDGGLPCAAFLEKIENGSPRRAVGVVTTVTLAVGGVFLLSEKAVEAVVGASVVALGVSYGVPILAGLCARGRSGAWWLKWVNVVAVVFVGVTTVLFLLPMEWPWSVRNMNYAGVAFLGVLGVAAVDYWVFGGRERFERCIKGAVEEFVVMERGFGD